MKYNTDNQKILSILKILKNNLLDWYNWMLPGTEQMNWWEPLVQTCSSLVDMVQETWWRGWFSWSSPPPRTQAWAAPPGRLSPCPTPTPGLLDDASTTQQTTWLKKCSFQIWIWKKKMFFEGKCTNFILKKCNCLFRQYLNIYKILLRHKACLFRL